MKILTCIILLLNISMAAAQVGPLISGLYDWNDFKGSEKNVLKGSTAYFEPFQVDILTLKPGDNLNSSTPNDAEELIILKEGKVGVTLGGKNKVMGPGSIAFMMPGEKYRYENNDNVLSVFYRLKFKSKFPLALERGKNGGGSFMVAWDSLVMKETDRGGRRDFFNRPTSTCKKFEMHVTTLHEGLPSHAPHTHPEEEIILLLKGNATMEVDNEYYEMAPGDFVFAASGDLHGIRNSGKGQCEYFAFQWK